MSKKKNTKKSPWLIFFGVAIAFTIFSNLLGNNFGNSNSEEIPISEFQKIFQDGKFTKVIQDGEIIIGYENESDKSGKKTVIPYNSNLKDLGLSPTDAPENTEWTAKSLENKALFYKIIESILPFLIIVGIIVFMMSRATKGGGNPFNFAQSKAKMMSKNKKLTKFKDVAGADEAKEQLEEIVDFLKNPLKYKNIGAKIPRGALLVGPPGTGKTLLARAVAGEADVPFMSISGSEFVEMFVGVGASRVRDMFSKAKKQSPSIIFIDEIDAVGKQRSSAGFNAGHDEREQTLNQILTEMDGFDNTTSVIVLAATNRPDVLDKALLRPGRFDRRVVINNPDIKAREEIMLVHAKNKPTNENIDWNRIARITVGFSGADLENLLNEAAILVAKQNRKTIEQKDIEISVEKIALGPEKKSLVMKEDQKRKTAYHETGHAIVAHLLENADPVHKVTIVSRGMALGVTWTMPTEDQYSISKSKFLDEVCVLLGGFATEEIFFGEHETGVANDLKVATNKIKSMITQYGMNEELGPVTYTTPEDHAGFEYLGTKGISEEYNKKIDEEVKKTMESCLKKTHSIIEDNKDLVKEIAENLLKVETLDKDEFEKFFNKN